MAEAEIRNAMLEIQVLHTSYFLLLTSLLKEPDHTHARPRDGNGSAA
jgi:hypothetical protein